MQFSLRNLMVFVLLSSLALSSWVFRQRLVETSAREIGLRQELVEASLRVSDFEQQRMLHERYMRAEEKRVQEFSTAEQRFGQIASQYGNLEIKDRRKLSVVSVSEWDRPGIKRQAWRVFVPVDQGSRLAVDFLPQEKHSSIVSSDDASRVLKTARLFEPGDPWMMDLPSGKSEIGLHWISTERERLIKMFFNGKEVKEFKFLELGNGYSSSPGPFDDQRDSDPQNPVGLYRLTPAVDTADFRETFWLRILPVDRKMDK